MGRTNEKLSSTVCDGNSDDDGAQIRHFLIKKMPLYLIPTAIFVKLAIFIYLNEQTMK